MAARTLVGTGALSASTNANWDGGGAIADGDSITIASDQLLQWDKDVTGWTTGIAGITLSGTSGHPCALVLGSSTFSGRLPIKAACNIAGTGAADNNWIVANDEGTIAGTTVLRAANTAIIEFLGTNAGKITGQYLRFNLRRAKPTRDYVRVYGTLYSGWTGSAAADTLTKTSHGLTDTTPVCCRSVGGTLPAPLLEDRMYYIVSKTTDTVKLAYTSGGAAIDLTTDGTGTLQLWTGNANTASGVVNVLDDVTTDIWATGDAAVLVDAGPQNYNQLRANLSDIAAGTMTLSANAVACKPLARIYRVKSNVEVLSNSTSSSAPIFDLTSNTANGDAISCSIRAVAGTGTTFYCYGVNAGTSYTIDSILTGCSNGTYYGTDHTVTGNIIGCNAGIHTGSGYGVSGSIAGCSNGIYSGSGHTISGSIAGCSNGTYYGTGHTISGSVLGCNNGINYSTGCMVSGVVSGCSYGINTGASNAVSGEVIGCAYGINIGSGTIIAGANLTGNTRDIYLGGRWIGYGAGLQSATQVANYLYTSVYYPDSYCLLYDVADSSNTPQPGYLKAWTPGGTCASYGVSSTEIPGLYYKQVTVSGTLTPDATGTYTYDGLHNGKPYYRRGSDAYFIWYYGDDTNGWMISSALGSVAVPRWKNSRASIAEASYAPYSTTTGTATVANVVASGLCEVTPITLPIVHVSTYESALANNFVEWELHGSAGLAITATLYAKSAQTSMTTRPTIAICSPRYARWNVTGILASGVAADNTDWQTVTASYTPTADGPLVVRVYGSNATGTTYWWQQTRIKASAFTNVVPASIKDGTVIDDVTGDYDPITGNYTDPGKANVVVGNDYTFAGASQVAAYPTTATSYNAGAADRLATDQGIVLAAAASIKDDATILGQAGTYDFTTAIATGYSNGAAAQLATDEAAVTAKVSYLDSTQTILGIAGTLDMSAYTLTASIDYPAAASVLSTDTVGGVAGTYHEATTAEVQDGVFFGPASAYRGTLEVTVGTGAQFLVLTVGGGA